MGDVLPALGELNTDSTILLNGTLLHNEALLVMLGKDPTFTTIVLGALDSKGQPVFPKYMDERKLAAKRRCSPARASLNFIIWNTSIG